MKLIFMGQARANGTVPDSENCGGEQRQGGTTRKVAEVQNLHLRFVQQIILLSMSKVCDVWYTDHYDLHLKCPQKLMC
jgi:hypothetical protein